MGEESLTAAHQESVAVRSNSQSPLNSEEAQSTEDSLSVWFLEQIDAIPYWIVGTVFWIAALLSLVYSLTAFVVEVFNQAGGPTGFTIKKLIDDGQGAQDIITLISDLLLTLIIMEVFGTVVYYLREHETTLKPFLFIGIISATRGILAVGARLSIGSISPEEFTRSMIELGVNGAVIIALGVTMKLIGNFLDQGPEVVPNTDVDDAAAGTTKAATATRSTVTRGTTTRSASKVVRRPPASYTKSRWILLARRVTVTVLLILILLVVIGLVIVLFNAAHN